MRKRTFAVIVAVLLVLPSFASAERVTGTFWRDGEVASVVEVTPLAPGEAARGLMCMAWTDELEWPYWATSWFSRYEEFWFNCTLWIKVAGEVDKAVVVIKRPDGYVDRIVYKGPWYLWAGGWYWCEPLKLSLRGIYTLKYKVEMGDRVLRRKVKVVIHD